MNIIGTVRDILTRKGKQVWSIRPDATVFDALKLMSEKNLGALLVMESGQLLGVMSERDYARKIVLVGKSSKETLVREIMSADLVCVTPQSTIDECMRLMTDKRMRHLPVVQNDQVVGVISIGDLVNWIISAQQVALDQLEGYITGKYFG